VQTLVRVLHSELEKLLYLRTVTDGMNLKDKKPQGTLVLSIPTLQHMLQTIENHRFSLLLADGIYETEEQNNNSRTLMYSRDDDSQDKVK